MALCISRYGRAPENWRGRVFCAISVIVVIESTTASAGPASAEDRPWMERALEQARLGLGLTSPNPPVGAVVVSADGELLGEGHHRKAGGPHAEVAALEDVRRRFGDNEAAQRLRGATLHVTLEPCSSHGRTPPCTEAIIEAGLASVVFASSDPTPANAHRAARILEREGIEVRSGVLREQGDRLLAPWFKWVGTGLPWVIAKAGLSLDGRLTRPPGESRWITSEAARADAMALRVRADAILIGGETLRRDNPRLTLRGDYLPPDKIQPLRVIWTRQSDWTDAEKAPYQVFTDEHSPRTRLVHATDWDAVLKELGAKSVTTLLVEGGGQVLGRAFAAGGVDEVRFYLAPRICGGGVPAVGGLEFGTGAASSELTEVQWTALEGGNMRISGLIQR